MLSHAYAWIFTLSKLKCKPRGSQEHTLHRHTIYTDTLTQTYLKGLLVPGQRSWLPGWFVSKPSVTLWASTGISLAVQQHLNRHALQRHRDCAHVRVHWYLCWLCLVYLHYFMSIFGTKLRADILRKGGAFVCFFSKHHIHFVSLRL